MITSMSKVLRLPRKLPFEVKQLRSLAPVKSAVAAVEMHIDDVERHECTVNSSELAGHSRDAQRSKHTCFSLTVRTPQCAHTVWGEKFTYLY